MNHVYRIVWNHATACYQAVTESATGPGKSRVKRAATAASAALCIVSLPSFAGPTGGQVTAGSATITRSGTATTINQASNKAAIDWTKFSVGANESVRFNQPSASALTLNRVTGTESSTILGSISANGQVFILNPNGVLFGAGSQVNVGGLTASTLRLDNANFMAGNYKFAGDAGGSVVNNGAISVTPGGTIALMAPLVQNTGTLSAPGGSVLLAGAQGVTLNLQADGGLVAYTLDAGSAQALVDNGGLIEAGGGHVVLTAKGVDALSKAVVNHSGVIEAQTVSNKGGVIELLSDMQIGSLTVSGKLDASAPNGGNGGFVETSAAHVKIEDSVKVTTDAPFGKVGQWLIDPTDIIVAVSGGTITPATLTAQLQTSGVVLQTNAFGTEEGNIFINDALNVPRNQLYLLAHNSIYINANVTVSNFGQMMFVYGQATPSGTVAVFGRSSSAQVILPTAAVSHGLQKGSAGVWSFMPGTGGPATWIPVVTSPLTVAEQQRLAEELRLQRLAEEQRRLAEELRQRREAEEQRRLAEELRLQREAEEQRRLAEELRLRREAEEQRRLAEELRLQREAEQRRLAELARLEQVRLADQARATSEIDRQRSVTPVLPATTPNIPTVLFKFSNDVVTSNAFQLLGASADYLGNLNSATAGVVGLENVNRATNTLLKIISGAEYGDLDGALKELSKATRELKNPSDLLGKSAEFAKGAGQVMQIVNNSVVIANSFSHALDGTYNGGDQNDLLLVSSLGIPGVNVIVAAITSPVTLSALAIQLASGGSISKALAANLDKAKGVSVKFNAYVNYLATSIADGSVSIEDARNGFATIKKMRYEELVSLRDQYRNVPGAITLALTGNMGDTTRVIDAIHNAQSAIENIDFSTVITVAAAIKRSQ